MFFLAILILGCTTSSYFAVRSASESSFHRKLRSKYDSFLGLFSLLPSSGVSVLESIKVIPFGSVKSSALDFSEFKLPGFEVLKRTSELPNYERFVEWNLNVVKSTLYDVNSEEDVKLGSTLFKQNLELEVRAQKQLYASKSLVNSCAVVFGALENRDVSILQEIGYFSHIITVDVWDNGQNPWGSTDLQISAQRVINDSFTCIKADQKLASLIITDKLRSVNQKLGFVLLEGSSNPYDYIPTALNAFDNLAEGGVLVLNSNPKADPAKICLLEESTSQMLIACSSVLSILRGRYVVLNNDIGETWYIGIKKVKVENDSDRSQISVWASPFGLTLDGLLPYFKPIKEHSLFNIHNINFFGLGTRIDKCRLCLKEVESNHKSGWEHLAGLKLGPCLTKHEIEIRNQRIKHSMVQGVGINFFGLGFQEWKCLNCNYTVNLDRNKLIDEWMLKNETPECNNRTV